MQQHLSTPSKKSLSEALLKTSENYSGDQKVVLETMSKLISEDENYFEDFTLKIQNRTGLDCKTIIKIIKESMKTIQIGIIAENMLDI